MVVLDADETRPERLGTTTLSPSSLQAAACPRPERLKTSTLSRGLLHDGGGGRPEHLPRLSTVSSRQRAPLSMSSDGGPGGQSNWWDSRPVSHAVSSVERRLRWRPKLHRAATFPRPLAIQHQLISATTGGPQPESQPAAAAKARPPQQHQKNCANSQWRRTTAARPTPK